MRTPADVEECPDSTPEDELTNATKPEKEEIINSPEREETSADVEKCGGSLPDGNDNSKVAEMDRKCPVTEVKKVSKKGALPQHTDAKSIAKVTEDTRYCPSCQADWRANEIPHEHRKHYGKHTHFSRLILVSSLELDRGVAWRCPDCGEEWERE